MFDRTGRQGVHCWAWIAVTVESEWYRLCHRKGLELLHSVPFGLWLRAARQRCWSANQSRRNVWCFTRRVLFTLCRFLLRWLLRVFWFPRIPKLDSPALHNHRRKSAWSGNDVLPSQAILHSGFLRSTTSRLNLVRTLCARNRSTPRGMSSVSSASISSHVSGMRSRRMSGHSTSSGG